MEVLAVVAFGGKHHVSGGEIAPFVKRNADHSDESAIAFKELTFGSVEPKLRVATKDSSANEDVVVTETVSDGGGDAGCSKKADVAVFCDSETGTRKSGE